MTVLNVTDTLILSGLYIYPVKSARGVAVKEARVGERGLDFDRHWMVVNSRGRQLTGREFPRLTLVAPAFEGDALRLSAPGLPDLRVPLCPDGPPREVSVFGDPLLAVSVSPEARDWFSAYLGAPVDFVRFHEASKRRMNPVYGQAHITFADGNPLHLVSEASVADLNARLARPVPIERFRPNLVVSGGAAYQEDAWRELTVSGVCLTAVEACARCSMLNIEDGHMQAEPLRTLAGYRRTGRTVLFGQNLVVRGAGRLSIGDALIF